MDEDLVVFTLGEDELGTFTLGEDELGTYIRFNVDISIYNKISLFKTAYWFTENYYLFISQGKIQNQLHVEIRSKNKDASQEDLKKACGDFYNYLLDQEVRQTIITETASIRDTLIKKAFFEAKKKVSINSLEKHLPDSTQSYSSDPSQIEQQS